MTVSPLRFLFLLVVMRNGTTSLSLPPFCTNSAQQKCSVSRKESWSRNTCVHRKGENNFDMGLEGSAIDLDIAIVVTVQLHNCILLILRRRRRALPDTILANKAIRVAVILCIAATCRRHDWLRRTTKKLPRQYDRKFAPQHRVLSGSSPPSLVHMVEETHDTL
jgi:hypothetical protein